VARDELESPEIPILYYQSIVTTTRECAADGGLGPGTSPADRAEQLGSVREQLGAGGCRFPGTSPVCACA